MKLKNEFRSARECAFALGLCELTVAVRLRDASQKVYLPGYQFKRKTDSTPWREITNLASELRGIGRPAPVRVRDIFTGVVSEYANMMDASRATGIPKHVLFELQKPSMPYFNYDVKFDDSDWVIWNEDQLNAFRQSIEANTPFRGRGYVLTDIASGERKVLAFGKQVMEILGISKSTLSLIARKALVS